MKNILFLDNVQNQNCLLNDNHSPGPWPGRLVPSSHQRSELSNTFSRGDRVWKCIPIPNVLGEKATLTNINISNGDLICHRMIIPAALTQGDKVICWYTGFTLQQNSNALKKWKKGMSNSVNPDQTALLMEHQEQSDQGLHCLPRPVCLNI